MSTYGQIVEFKTGKVRRTATTSEAWRGAQAAAEQVDKMWHPVLANCLGIFPDTDGTRVFVRTPGQGG